MSTCNTPVRVSDEGTTFEMTITSCESVVDISSATLKQITFVSPTGAKIDQTAVFSTDGTDGKIRYVTVTNDIDMPGTWKTQGYIESTSGKWHTTVDTFEVEDNL